MSNPYALQAPYAFWKRSMSGHGPLEVDPVTEIPFGISRGDKVATAGSCFAQHISRTLVDLGFSYLVTEKAPEDCSEPESYGVFPARFANVYTTRQLLQLLQRACGLFEPTEIAWRRKDGRYIDPFRPRITAAGFASEADLLADRERHFVAVRDMLEQADVFVFTLGLTEGWEDRRDRAIFPLAPGVVGADDAQANCSFINFTVAEVEADLGLFIDHLRKFNPTVRIILTVSPVALVATCADRHVLAATTYSKSVLRVAAETISRARPSVAYFPSYEIITGPHARGQFYENDLREVRPEAVAHVMDIFARHYLSERTDPWTWAPAATMQVPEMPRHEIDADEALARVICDEQAIDEAL